MTSVSAQSDVETAVIQASALLSVGALELDRF